MGTGEDGYTLVEVLVALMIIGLALSALGEAVHVVGQMEHRGARLAREEDGRRALGNGFAGLFQGAGPISSAGQVSLHGSASSLQFDCGSSTCLADLTGGQKPSLRLQNGALGGGPRAFALPDKAAYRFDYLGSKTRGDHWPPDNPTDWQRLRAVEIVRANGGLADIAASARLWTEGSGAPSAGRT